MANVHIRALDKISIKAIRDFILDLSITEEDSIILHPENFANIVYEFRETYKTSIDVPYYLLTVLVKEDNLGKVPLDRIGVLKGDTSRFEGDFKTNVVNKESPNESYAYDTIYRCGWCGNVVDFDGSEFEYETRRFKIKVLEKFKHTVLVKHVDGKCCPDGHRS